MNRSRLKSWTVGLLKYGVSLVILAWLVHDASQNDTFERVIDQPKHWGYLVAAWSVCFSGVVISMIRWRVLVNALGIPFGLGQSLRLGFLGYLFNFISLGAVGGDLVKAVAIARERPDQRAEGVATVLVDRIVGLYSLLVFSSVAILLLGQYNAPQEQVRLICRSTLLITAGATVGIAALLMVGGRLLARKPSASMPRALHMLWQLTGAMTIYRRHPRSLLIAMALSIVVHGSLAIGFYLIARGLPGVAPSLAEHLVIVPLSMLTGVLPLPVNGLGALEGVVDYLYQHVPAAGLVAMGQGLGVALVYRAMTIVIAMVGAVFYLLHRAEVDDAMRGADEEEAAAEIELEQAV